MLLAIELSLRCQMCDLHSKFEEDRTKTATAVVDDRYFEQTDKQTDRQTNKQTQVICLSNTMHCIGGTIKSVTKFLYVKTSSDKVVV